MFLSKVILKHIVKMHHVLRSGLINQFMSDGKPSKFYSKTSISTYIHDTVYNCGECTAGAYNKNWNMYSYRKE
jgi:hypothetical protein